MSSTVRETVSATACLEFTRFGDPPPSGGPLISPSIPLVIRRVAVTMTELAQGSRGTPRSLRARKDPAAGNHLAVL